MAGVGVIEIDGGGWMVMGGAEELREGSQQFRHASTTLVALLRVESEVQVRYQRQEGRSRTACLKDFRGRQTADGI